MYIEWIRFIHINCPERGLSIVWTRLDKGYRLLEIVQNILKQIKTFSRSIRIQMHNKSCKVILFNALSLYLLRQSNWKISTWNWFWCIQHVDSSTPYFLGTWFGVIEITSPNQIPNIWQKINSTILKKWKCNAVQNGILEILTSC